MKTHSKPSNLKVLLPLFLFLACFLFAVLFRGEVSGFLSQVVAPIWKVQNEWGSRERQQEKQAETSRLTRLKLDILRSENERLRSILGRQEVRNLIVAGVLAKPPVTPYDVFILDAGSRVGVRSGAQVFVHGNVAVGKVASVTSDTSKIKLYSSPGETTQVLIGKENVSGEVHGIGGGSFRTKLPQGVKVMLDAKVFVPGLQGGVLGVVKHIQKKEEDTFQTIFIKSPVNVWTYRYLEIEAR